MATSHRRGLGRGATRAGCHAEELHASLRQAPQTNEPARTAALVVGLAEAVRRTGLRRCGARAGGASAGLGLLVDHYRFVGDDWATGPRSSPLTVERCGAAGFVPEVVEVVHRRGCDVAPVDAATDEGAAYLTSFVWPWQLDRHARLAAALEVAREHPVVVDRAPASTWVAQRLAEPVDDGVLTVVWHSVTRLYWPAEETEAMTAAVGEARARIRGRTSPWSTSGRPAGDDARMPLLTVDDDVVATCDHHGPPVVLAT